MLAPWFLLGGLAVGLPLYLHLLQRNNPIRLPFSSLMFFEKRTQTTFLQRRFRYLLLLALRLSLLILAALAFAKPVWERPPAAVASDAPSLHLVILDTSMSMQFGDRWERAVAEAREIVSGLGGSDRGQILTTGPSVSVITQPSRDQGDLTAAIEGLEPSLSRNSYGDVIEAVRSLTPESETRVIAHLISDFQSTAMPGRFSELVLPTAAELDIRNVGGPTDANWAIESVKGTLRLFGETEPRLDVTVSAFSDEPQRKTVTLTINGQSVGSESQEVPAMGRASFLFEGFEAPPGFSRAEVAITPADELPADDRRLIVLDNSEPEPILFITNDRRRRDALYFRAALDASAAARFQVRTSSPGEAARLRLNDYAFVVLSDVLPSAGFEQSLREYAEAGGSVLIAAGPEVAQRGAAPVTEHRLASGRVGDRPGADFFLAGAVDPSFPPLESVEGFRGVKFFWYARVEPGEGDDVVARLGDGSPLIIERPLGAGRALVFASTFDNVRNDLPVQPLFVPFVVETARYLSGASEDTRQAIVGQTFELRRRREGQAMVQVVDPSGARVLSLSEAVSRNDIALDQVGFYEVQAPDETELVAVNPDPRESNLRPIDAETLDLWQSTGLGAADPAAEAAVPGEAVQPPPLRIWRFLLFLLMAVVLLESVVGNRHLNVRREV